MNWYWIRVREGLRWLFRGGNFTKLKLNIENLAAPLADNSTPEADATKRKERIKYALTWLPKEEAAPFYEMMARIGHSIRS